MAGAVVVFTTSIANGNIEEPVRTKFDRASIMIGLWMIDFKNYFFCARIGRIRACSNSELRYPGQIVPGSAWLGPARMRRCSIKDIKLSIGFKVRVESQS